MGKHCRPPPATHAADLAPRRRLSTGFGGDIHHSEHRIKDVRIVVMRNMPASFDADTRRDIVDELSKFGDLGSIKMHEHTTDGGVVVVKFHTHVRGLRCRSNDSESTSLPRSRTRW